MTDSAAPLVWIDLEMTGLFPDSCHILEIATVVTDAELRVLGRGPDIVIHQPPEIVEEMNPWCKEHHGNSGLTEQVLASKVPLEEAEALTLDFVKQHVKEAGVAPICGNSVDLDGRFLRKFMPSLYGFLKEQIIDVSTLKEIVRRWYPSLAHFEKAGSHRALDDILESIEELRYYREHVFRGSLQS